MFALDAASLVTHVLRTTGRDELGDDRLSPAIDLLGADLDSGTSQLHLAGRREAQRLLRRLLARRGQPVLPDPTAGPMLGAATPLLVAALPTTPAESVASAVPDEWSGADVVTWSSLPSAGAGGLFARDAMHACAVDLHSALFECAWHVPAYAEWLSEQVLDPTYTWLCRGLDGSTPAVLRSLTFGLNPPSSRWSGHTIVVPATDHDIRTFIDAVIQFRYRFSHRVDPDSVERYWRWRLDWWPRANPVPTEG